MKTTRKQYIREQKTICGDSYAEVDFCWITEREHRAGPRGKKKFASSLAQQKRNRERSARLLVQLLNTNFDQRGFALTLTYEDMWLPDDDEAAWKDVYNYLFLSTLSLRRATAKVHKTVGHFCAYETNFMEIASSC